MGSTRPCGLLVWRLLVWRLLLCGLSFGGQLACGRAPAEARSAAAPAADAAQGYGYAEEAARAPEGLPAPHVRGLGGPAGEAPPAPSPPAASAAPSAPVVPAPAASGGSAAEGAPVAAGAAKPGDSPARQRAPLLIYRATLTLAVFGTGAALDAVERLARERGGYLVRRTDASITIRVPAEQLEDVLGKVGALGDELHRDVSAQDVTEEYADLATRLRNAEVMRQRLEALLERATKVEDALAVGRELERVTRDIEQIKGRLALLGELIRFSTITVNFQAAQVEAVARDNPLPFEWLRRLGLPHLLRL